MAPINNLIKKVDDLKEQLKEANLTMNKSLVDTELYKKFLTFVLDENIAEKPAKAQALKLTYEFFKAQ
jgi:hypothetical protein